MQWGTNCAKAATISFAAAADSCFHSETAIYCIEDGYKITVAPLAGADEEKVRVYLLGTCMGALLMLRNTLPLHGSAVVIDGRAYAFLGDSGVGKSTLAAALVHQGYPLVSDDVIATTARESDAAPLVMPAYPQQKLWGGIVSTALVWALGVSSHIPGTGKVCPFRCRSQPDSARRRSR